MHVLLRLTTKPVNPKIRRQTAHTGRAGTICDSSHQHSCLSRDNDGQNASHSAYTSYSAWPSLVAGSERKTRKIKPILLDETHTHTKIMNVSLSWSKTSIQVIAVPLRSSSHSVAALTNCDLEESSFPVLHYCPLMLPERAQILAYIRQLVE